MSLKNEYQELLSSEELAENSSRVKLGANDTIYEDEWVRIKFLKWEQIHYINTGPAHVAHFLFENNSRRKVSFYFKNTSVGGFLNNEETISYELPPKQKGMQKFNLIYDDQVPGNTEDFGTVEFVACYGMVEDGYSSKIDSDTLTESDVISLKI